MKVAVYEKVEISDEQRVAIAALVDGEGAKKRKATSAEMKAFVWEHGRGWDVALAQGLGSSALAGPQDADGDADEDLLGTGTPAPADTDPDLEDLL